MKPLVASHLLQLWEGQWVAVLRSKLHEPHVGWMSKLSDDTEAGKQPWKQTSATLKNENQPQHYISACTKHFCCRSICVHAIIKSAVLWRWNGEMAASQTHTTHWKNQCWQIWNTHVVHCCDRVQPHLVWTVWWIRLKYFSLCHNVHLQPHSTAQSQILNISALSWRNCRWSSATSQKFVVRLEIWRHVVTFTLWLVWLV